MRRAFSALLILIVVLALPSWAAERPRLRVDNYVIDAEIVPRAHRLNARARVTFTALDDITVASFELHNALRPTRVLDAAGKPLSFERVSQDSTVRVSLPAGLSKDASTTITFDYEGVLSSADDSPVQGLKLAYVGEEESYLLYAGRWFPMVGYGTNRFTATIHVSVPKEFTVIGSGREAAGSIAPTTSRVEYPDMPGFMLASFQKRGKKTKPAEKPAAPAKSTAPKEEPPQPIPAPRRTLVGAKVYTFVWDKPSFPGTIIAGRFEENTTNAGGLSVRVYFKPAHKALAPMYAETAVKEFQYFSGLYGPTMSSHLKIVELPDDTVPSAWAPEIAAVASRAITEKINYRLLANTIAHQWWGVLVSPASKDDWWLSDGFSRYSEARYVESTAGVAGYEEATRDMSVGALAYDTVPLSSVGKLDTFSPEFQSLVTDKGAVILHMLRWVIGDQPFDNTMRAFATQYAGKPASVDSFRQIAEQNHGDKLTWFFAQWLDSTGAPDFKTKYTVYRVQKGFRVVGEIAQDLDLFRMPVEIRIDTDGKSELKRIDVVGTNSPFTVETFGKPRRIQVDPANQVLKNSPDLKVRTAILRGQGLVQQGDLAESLKEFQKALDVNKNSSLAHYRIAEVFFLQRNYQAAANAYRESLNGDGEPKWTEVWSHLQLGKIFDITGQRERATNEYRQALQTNDNTQGALEEARRYLQAPYQREKPREG